MSRANKQANKAIEAKKHSERRVAARLEAKAKKEREAEQRQSGGVS